MRRVGFAAMGLASWLAATPALPQPGPQARVILRPAVAKLGERVVYRVEVTDVVTHRLRWMAPDSSARFAWGAARSGVARGRPRSRERFGAGSKGPGVDLGTPDTAWIEIPLQAFTLGRVPVPGIAFQYPAYGLWPRETTGRAPVARLVVVAVMTAADSDAVLHPVRGPLAAPWWERVPWRWVLAGLALVALAVVLVRRLRPRRHPTPLAAPATAASPVEDALLALAALRSEHLPQQGRLAEHAFRLGQILRRLLEATVRTARPGDTTPELLRHLSDAQLDAEDLRRLAGLLRAWDRVKFAREPMSVEEAIGCETAVESFVRRGGASERETRVA